MWMLLIALVLLLFSIVWMSMKPKPTVYGSMGCGYTVKLRNSIGPHNFVDCSTQTCPDFVSAYPTTKYPDGTIKVGA